RGLVVCHPRLHLRSRHPRLRRAGLADRRLAAHPAALRHRWRLLRRVRRVHADLLRGAEKHGERGRGTREGVRPYLLLLGLGAVLVAVLALLGGRPAAIGAATAVLAQDRKSTRL